MRTSFKLGRHNLQRSTPPLSAYVKKKRKEKSVWYYINKALYFIQSCVNQSTFSLHLMPTWPETFLRCLVDIKEAPRRDISIQETCWLSYQASKSLVSFWKGLMRVMEMLKGVLAPNITKGWENMNKLRLKDWKEREHDKKGKHWNAFSRETDRERERGEALGSISA